MRFQTQLPQVRFGHINRVALASLTFGSLALLSGCASVPRPFQERVQKLERGIEDMRNVQAEIIARVDALENLSRNVTGKVEELEFSQSRAIGGAVSGLKEDLSRLQRRIPPPALVPLLPLEEDESLLQTYHPEIARLFSNELNRLRTGNYRLALPGLRHLADSQSPDDVRARAMFWIGVAEEGVGNNPDALRAYYSLAQNFPSHPRVAVALGRQASVFIRLRDIPTAKLTLQKLIAQFPNTPEAADAKQKLQKLR